MGPMKTKLPKITTKSVVEPKKHKKGIHALTRDINVSTPNNAQLYMPNMYVRGTGNRYAQYCSHGEKHVHSPSWLVLQ